MEMFLCVVICVCIPVVIVLQDQWSCRASQFKCKNHRCFSIFDRCDGQDDCGDGSDEEDCDRWTCPAGGEWWQCSDPQCVRTSSRCDGRNDCRDGSDEDNCDRWKCPAGVEWWQCSNAQCVRTYQRCDGNFDCRDHSDENSCDRWTCPAGGEWWQCSDPQCVRTSSRCDGRNDCRDGSDEDNCDRWKCPAGVEWWQCSNAQCVRTYQRCDGNFDCRDHSDENSCDRWTCPAGGEWWQCNDTQCVRTSYRCDGDNDCRDGSDEDNCDRWTCPAGGEWWQCNDTQCVRTSYRCDGDNDCRDGSDEDNCDRWTCPAGGEWWQCNDTQCVRTSYRCDGDNDCRDGSDEDNCDRWTCPAGGEWWQCNDTQCVRTSYRCDGDNDCRDGSDEDNCDYILQQCTNGILQISETELHKPIYCDRLQGRDVVNWERNEGQDETSNVAFCQNENQNYSCDSVDRDVRVSRNTSTSQLVIANYTRSNWVNSTLTCVRADRARMDSCRIRVMYPAVLGHTTVTLHDNFTVTATVTVEKVFDSDFNITGLWNIVEGKTTKHSQTTRSSLSSFTETQTGRVFHNGTCSVMIDAPSEEGNFLVYVTIEPGGGLSLVGDFNITKPGELRLQTRSCPEYVAERQTLQCQCRHVSKETGLPPARVYWAQQSGSAVLTVNNVTMKDNGIVYTCHSTWGPSGEVHASLKYTILVAYGKHTKSSIVVVGGGIAGGVFIIAVVIVIVVVKLKCRDDTYEKPRRRRNRGTSHVYLDLDPVSATSQATSSVDNTSNPQPSSVTSGATGDVITRETRLHADRDLSARGGNSGSDYLTPSAGDSDYTEIKDEEEEHKYTNDSVQPTAAADDHYANDPHYNEIKEPLPQDRVPQTAARRQETEPSPYEEVE